MNRIKYVDNVKAIQNNTCKVASEFCIIFCIYAARMNGLSVNWGHHFSQDISGAGQHHKCVVRCLFAYIRK